ncbi:VOC family protein [Haloarcula argentinensis]|uniref:Glyoxalase n=1 Tax=Haloarcula argentinensis TaxID=43776 RepID=A0ABU2EW56_HALAR|nr:VOC family protein [Haloarcula argentinensis]MDS0252500.1 glyoxalase [Haloarcula argentinensis]
MAKIQFITIACNDAERLAEFWAAALDGERQDLPASLDPELVERPSGSPDLLFKEQPKGTERDLPIHLDLATENREETVEQLRQLGGTVRETKTEAYETHTST